MTTMLERAAISVQEAISDAFFDNVEPDPKDIARAILMAVREPDEDLCNAASWSANEARPESYGFYCSPEMFAAAHASLIDAILNEPTT